MHILAVDDNQIHCYAMRKMLEHSGFRVSIAHTGQDAMEIALRDEPSAVLLDVNLPDTTGYEVCSQLKSNERTCRIPVIFHTATEATAVAKNRAEGLGASAFLTYPIQLEHLIAVVKAAVIRSKRSA